MVIPNNNSNDARYWHTYNFPPVDSERCAALRVVEGHLLQGGGEEDKFFFFQRIVKGNILCNKRLPPSTTIIMSTPIVLPLTLHTQFKSNDDGNDDGNDDVNVTAELTRVHKRHTVTRLSHPPRLAHLQFATLGGAAKAVCGHANQGIFVVALANLSSSVVALCKEFAEPPPKLHHALVQQQQFVDVRVLLYLEYLLKVHFVGNSPPTKRFTTYGTKTNGVVRVQGQGLWVWKLNDALAVGDMRAARTASQNCEFRHIVQLPVDVQKAYTMDPQHPSGAHEFTRFAHQPSTSKQMVGPKDVFGALWLANELRHNNQTIFRVLPDKSRSTNVSPVDIDLRRLAGRLEHAWANLAPGCLRFVEIKWLRLSVGRCKTLAELLHWWVAEVGRCKSVGVQDVHVLMRRNFARLKDTHVHKHELWVGTVVVTHPTAMMGCSGSSDRQGETFDKLSDTALRMHNSLLLLHGIPPPKRPKLADATGSEDKHY